MKKRIELVSSVQSELSVGDLADITGGMPGRYSGRVEGGRPRDPQPSYGHGRDRDRSDRPAQPYNGPNRPTPSSDGVLPPGQPGGGRNSETYYSMYGH